MDRETQRQAATLDTPGPRAGFLPAGPIGASRARSAIEGAGWIWCLVLLCLVALKLGPSLQPLRWNDSYQYLSVAANLHEGRVGYTSLVHYDEERGSGMVPAPSTTFPLGYPLLMGGLEFAGLSGEAAGLLISTFAMLAAVLLLNALAGQLGLGAAARHWVLALFVLGTFTPSFAGAVMSEAAFTGMTLAAFALLLALLRSAERGKADARLAIFTGLAFGLAYWLRYAGLFTLLGLLPVALAAGLLGRRTLARDLMIAFASGCLPVALGMARNIAIVGSWRGGNTKSVDHSGLQLAHDFAIALRDLLLGAAPMTQWIGLRGVLLALLALAVVSAWRICAKAARGAPRAEFAPIALGIVALTYLSCLTYAAARTGISYGARYFYPMLPIFLLAGGLALNAVASRIASLAGQLRWYGLGYAMAAVYALLQLGQLFEEPVPDLHARIAQRLDARVTPSASGRELLHALAGPGVIVASVGQATGYVLQQPTVSLVGRHLGAVEWNEANLQALMRRFQSHALVVYKTGSDGAVDEFPSRFIEQLAAGEAPNWLRRAGESDGLVIYQARW